jgi:hypothetical protein
MSFSIWDAEQVHAKIGERGQIDEHPSALRRSASRRREIDRRTAVGRPVRPRRFRQQYRLAGTACDDGNVEVAWSLS